MNTKETYSNFITKYALFSFKHKIKSRQKLTEPNLIEFFSFFVEPSKKNELIQNISKHYYKINPLHNYNQDPISGLIFNYQIINYLSKNLFDLFSEPSTILNKNLSNIFPDLNKKAISIISSTEQHILQSRAPSLNIPKSIGYLQFLKTFFSIFDEKSPIKKEHFQTIFNFIQSHHFIDNEILLFLGKEYHERFIKKETDISNDPISTLIINTILKTQQKYFQDPDLKDISALIKTINLYYSLISKSESDNTLFFQTLTKPLSFNTTLMELCKTLNKTIISPQLQKQNYANLESINQIHNPFNASLIFSLNFEISNHYLFQTVKDSNIEKDKIEKTKKILLFGIIDYCNNNEIKISLKQDNTLVFPDEITQTKFLKFLSLIEPNFQQIILNTYQSNSLSKEFLESIILKEKLKHKITENEPSLKNKKI